MSYPTPSVGLTAKGTGASRVGPTDAASAIQVMVSALQSGTELALIKLGTPSADVLAAMELLNGSTVDIGASYLPLVHGITTSATALALVATDEWDDVRDAIDAL